MALKITIDIVDEDGIRRIGCATLVRVDNGAESAPDYAIIANESANPVTGREAWRRRGLITGQPVRRSIFALCEAACRWCVLEAEKP
jgi:hypothetical protein